jgi:transposase
MTIVGGLDIHRQQITYDYVDTSTGEVERGQIGHADRRRFAAWLRRFEGCEDVEFAVEGCTGWRYVVEELVRAGITPHLAEPADTAAARGRKRHAKTDRTDSHLIRDLLLQGRLPECYIPPSDILELRALLECYQDLRRDHTAWTQRIHAVLFHQGGPAWASHGMSSDQAGEQLRRIAAEHVSPAGQTQIEVALLMLEATEAEMGILHGRLVTHAKHLRGARYLSEKLYGVGPLTALALTCWLGGAGRFSSSRKAVRFTGLDITVHSSAGKRAGPGRLSRQGPPALRWLLYEAGKQHGRGSAPDHTYYANVKARIDGKRAALSEARKLVRHAVHLLNELGDDAFIYD